MYFVLRVIPTLFFSTFRYSMLNHQQLNTMNTYHKNPRKMGDERKEKLKQNLLELGDLSGVVHDLNSDEIIGGNQRSSIFDINHAEIKLVRSFNPPTPQGTVALGYISWQGEMFAYRQVRWTPEQCEKANITANALGGEFDYDMLMEEFNPENLKDWGVDLNLDFDLSGLEDMAENSFRDAVNSSDKFQVTFVFGKEKKGCFDRYFKEKGKEQLSEEILKIVSNA